LKILYDKPYVDIDILTLV